MVEKKDKREQEKCRDGGEEATNSLMGVSRIPASLPHSIYLSERKKREVGEKKCSKRRGTRAAAF